MDAKTQIEYDRIKAGPHSGEFTFLHHEGPVVEHSDNVMERLADILSGRPDKPVSQQYDRLRHIYPVSATAYKAYQEAITPAYKAYQEAITTAYKAYQEAKAPAEKAYQEAKAPAEKAYQEAKAPAEKAILALIPNCAWDGKSILGKI